MSLGLGLAYLLGCGSRSAHRRCTPAPSAEPPAGARWSGRVSRRTAEYVACNIMLFIPDQTAPRRQEQAAEHFSVAIPRNGTAPWMSSLPGRIRHQQDLWPLAHHRCPFGSTGAGSPACGYGCASSSSSATVERMGNNPVFWTLREVRFSKREKGWPKNAQLVICKRLKMA